MSKTRILVQLDVDTQASVFDSVVAIDAGVDHLLRHHRVEPSEVRDLVYGTMFTRGVDDLRYTAVFVGGSNVAAAEEVLKQVKQCFFGPMRVSVLFDANGSNTTAAAAVLRAQSHLALEGATATVLGATGPVGQRAALLLARAGTSVRIASRRQERAEQVCHQIRTRWPIADVIPWVTGSATDVIDAVSGSAILIAAGAAGIELVAQDAWSRLEGLRVAVDLNAVPPAGIASIAPADAGVERNGVVCYGAIGVGQLKMRIHKAAIRTLFASNDSVLDAEDIFAVGQQLFPEG